MNDWQAVRGESSAIEPLLARVRRALAHDLRTPLGTIGNYATILEYHDQAKPEDVRVFAQRIRGSVVRTAAMLTHLTDALTLALSEPGGQISEPATILRALLAELGLQGRFPMHGTQQPGCADLDPQLLRFCWRAFLGASVGAAPQADLDLDVSCSQLDGFVTADLCLGMQDATRELERIDTEAFVQERLASPAQDACFALSLAETLARARGGSLELLGRDGIASLLRLRLPSSP